jgi:hypothetical protein
MNDWGGAQILLSERRTDRIARVVLTACEAFDNYPVGAGNCVTLCDLGIFVDQAAEPIPPKDPGACAESRWMHAPGGRVLRQRGCAGALAPGASETSCQAAR